jgi:hypothetical protein
MVQHLRAQKKERAARQAAAAAQQAASAAPAAAAAAAAAADDSDPGKLQPLVERLVTAAAVASVLLMSTHGAAVHVWQMELTNICLLHNMAVGC